MNILILNSARKFTGEAAHCIDLAEQLQLQGHNVRLVVRADSLLLKRALDRKIPVALILQFSGGIRRYSVLNDFFRLRQLIIADHIEILHCHRGDDHGLAAAVAVTLGKRRPAVVRTRHRVMPVRNTRGNQWLYQKATAAVIAVSNRAAESFGAMRPLIEDKLTIVYSSVDTVNFHPDKRCAKWRAEHGLADDEPLIGLIARLQRVKGQEQFLRAAALVNGEFPRARFLIAGAGPPHKYTRLASLVAELGLRDRVIIKEWLPDVNTVTASLDIGVLASLGSEGSSRVTYEYMASGVPVVATSVGCIPEVVLHGETGYVVPPNDVDALADAIIHALKSPDLRTEMQTRALDRIHQFHNRNSWVSRTMEVYNQALNHRNHKSLH